MGEIVIVRLVINSSAPRVTSGGKSRIDTGVASTMSAAVSALTCDSSLSSVHGRCSIALLDRQLIGALALDDNEGMAYHIGPWGEHAYDKNNSNHH
uniref:Uncharacterized protein n=1 Tax=Romanomermis culicivorax TaxID=13658 RepID=A0A915IUS0_ROMCU